MSKYYLNRKEVSDKYKYVRIDFWLQNVLCIASIFLVFTIFFGAIGLIFIGFWQMLNSLIRMVFFSDFRNGHFFIGGAVLFLMYLLNEVIYEWIYLMLVIVIIIAIWQWISTIKEYYYLKEVLTSDSEMKPSDHLER
jgi:hypothetical protein